MLMFALILEISASIAAYAMRGNIKLLLKDRMYDALNHYDQQEEREAIDFLQSRVSVELY